MDTVGTPALHKVLSKHKMITCPAKHYLKNNVAKFKKGEKNSYIFSTYLHNFPLTLTTHTNFMKKYT